MRFLGSNKSRGIKKLLLLVIKQVAEDLSLRQSEPGYSLSCVLPEGHLCFKKTAVERELVYPNKSFESQAALLLNGSYGFKSRPGYPEFHKCEPVFDRQEIG